MQFLFSNEGRRRKSPSPLSSSTYSPTLLYSTILALHVFIDRSTAVVTIRRYYINTCKETFTWTILDGLTPTVEVMACAINDKPLGHG